MTATTVRSRQVPVDLADNPDVYAVRLYVQFLQGLFNFNDTGCLHWEPDIETTEIVIRAGAPIDLSASGKRPVITVVPGPTQFQGMGGINQMQSMNLRTQVTRHSDMVSGFLVAYCLAESDIAAQWIAHQVGAGTQFNRALLESSGGFHNICRPGPQYNAPSPPGGLILGDPRGLVMVQTTIPYTMQWSWQTTPKSPPQDKSLGMITDKRRAIEYPYADLQELERVTLSISLKPVYVRRLGSSGDVRLIRDRIPDYQTVIDEPQGEE